MIPNQDIHVILKAAASAPSGHNYQPWKFQVLGDEIVFINIPENDPTIYNYKQRGSYVAHGAAIENAIVAAESLGYSTAVEILSDASSNTTARLKLWKDAGSGRASLHPSIEKRVTNRKPYATDKIPSKLAELAVLPADIGISGAVLFEESDEGIASVASAWSVNDWLIFNERLVHDALFPHIVWDKKTENEKKTGLFIDTFELPPPVRSMFNVLKHWPIASFFGSIGFGNEAGKQNAESVYTKTAAIGAVMVPDLSKSSLIKAGRILEYVWLRATSMHLSIQPVMGAYYLSLRAEEDEMLSLHPESIKRLRTAKSILTKRFAKNGYVPAVLFRIGEADEPSALSSKKTPIIAQI